MTRTKSRTPNERIKRDYVEFLRHTLGRSEASLGAVAAALARFESYTKQRDFKAFHVEQAKGFKAHLSGCTNARSGAPLSASTITSTLTTLRDFFRWLATQPGYRSKLKQSDADYFSPPTSLARVASARREKPCPTLEQIRAVLDRMPHGTELEKRDRALIAFTILTGARDGAIASLRLKHVDVAAGRVDQDARDVATKNAKTFTTFFFPVGDDVRVIVTDWVAFLRREKLWGENDPLFPSTEMTLDPSGRFAPAGLSRTPWSTATPIRKIFRTAFDAAGLPYANPHSFRSTLARLAYRMDLTPEQLKAWSQNLGHEDVLTTLTSYGVLPVHRQGEIVLSLGSGRTSSGELAALDPATVQRVLTRLLAIDASAR